MPGNDAGEGTMAADRVTPARSVGAAPRSPSTASKSDQSTRPDVYSGASSTTRPDGSSACTANAYSRRCGFQAAGTDSPSTRYEHAHEMAGARDPEVERGLGVLELLAGGQQRVERGAGGRRQRRRRADLLDRVEEHLV